MGLFSRAIALGQKDGTPEDSSLLRRALEAQQSTPASQDDSSDTLSEVKKKLLS